MKSEEVKAMKARLAEHAEAERVLNRMTCICETLSGITDKENNVYSIVINIQDKEFKYRARQDSGDARICKLESEDHEELFNGFIEWAQKTIQGKIDAAKERMEKA